MSIETQVVWAPGSDTSAVQAKGVELADLQPEPMTFSTDPVTSNTTVTRFWVDTEAATNWIVFVEGYNPLSATIIS